MLRARLKILDILDRRAGGQTALVVYSSNAFTVTPLTSDTDTIAALVNSLSTDIMPSRGSYVAAAV
jgi:Ca-activated chloride channel family protein